MRNEGPQSASPAPAHPIECRKFRVDSAPAAGAAGRTGNGSLLGLFRRRAVAPPERRNEARHEAIEGRAWLGWKRWRGFRAPYALIVNISRGGALVFLDEPPPAGKPVWIFLETPDLKTVVKARVLEIQTTPAGQSAVRLAFEKPCPFAVFDAAVCGVQPADPKRRMNLKPRPPTRELTNVSGRMTRE